MNLTLLSSFLVSLASLAIEISGGGSILKIVLYTIIMVISFVPTTIGLYNFISTPRTKWKLLLIGFYKYLDGENYENYVVSWIKKGTPLYCNPLSIQPIPCTHQQLSFTTKGSQGFITCDFERANYNGPKEDLMVGIVIEDKYHYSNLSMEFSQIDTLKDGTKVRWLLNKKDYPDLIKDSKCELIYICFYDKIQVRLQYYSGFLESKQIMSYTDEIISVEFKKNQSKSSFLNICNILTLYRNMSLGGKSCCFLLCRFTKGRRRHSVSLSKFFNDVSNTEWNDCKLYYNQEVSGESFVEGVSSKAKEKLISVINFKYSESFLDCLEGYNRNFTCQNEGIKDKIIETLALGFSWPWRIDLTNNWQWKRIGSEVSYLLESYGYCCIKGVDLKVKPRVRVQNFSKMYESSAFENKKLIREGRIVPVPVNLMPASSDASKLREEIKEMKLKIKMDDPKAPFKSLSKKRSAYRGMKEVRIETGFFKKPNSLSEEVEKVQAVGRKTYRDAVKSFKERELDVFRKAQEEGNLKKKNAAKSLAIVMKCNSKLGFNKSDGAELLLSFSGKKIKDEGVAGKRRMRRESKAREREALVVKERGGDYSISLSNFYQSLASLSKKEFESVRKSEIKRENYLKKLKESEDMKALKEEQEKKDREKEEEENIKKENIKKEIIKKEKEIMKKEEEEKREEGKEIGEASKTVDSSEEQDSFDKEFMRKRVIFVEKKNTYGINIDGRDLTKKKALEVVSKADEEMNRGGKLISLYNFEYSNVIKGKDTNKQSKKERRSEYYCDDEGNSYCDYI